MDGLAPPITILEVLHLYATAARGDSCAARTVTRSARPIHAAPLELSALLANGSACGRSRDGTAAVASVNDGSPTNAALKAPTRIRSSSSSLIIRSSSSAIAQRLRQLSSQHRSPGDNRAFTVPSGNASLCAAEATFIS